MTFIQAHRHIITTREPYAFTLSKLEKMERDEKEKNEREKKKKKRKESWFRVLPSVFFNNIIGKTVIVKTEIPEK